MADIGTIIKAILYINIVMPFWYFDTLTAFSGDGVRADPRNILVAKDIPTMTGRIKSGSGVVRFGNQRAPKIKKLK